MSHPLEKAPTYFWIVSGVFLLWNLMGVMAFVMQITMSPETLATLPEGERALYESTPAWANAAFGLAVFAGTLGSLFLLLRKAWALPALVASLVGIAVQLFHAFALSDALQVLGPGGLVMPILVTVGGVGLLFFARSAQSRRWIL